MSTTNFGSPAIGAAPVGAARARERAAADAAPGRWRRLSGWQRLISPLVAAGRLAARQRRRPGLGEQAAAAHQGREHRRDPDHHQLSRVRDAAARAAGLAGADGVGFALGATRRARCWRSSPGSAASGEDAVDPLMQMVRTLPLFGLVPVFIVWFGIGQLPKLLLIALGRGDPAVPQHVLGDPRRRRPARVSSGRCSA